MKVLKLLEESEAANTLSSCLLLTWVAMTLVLPLVTTAGLICHAIRARHARKLDATAIALAVGVVVFFLSFLAVGRWRVIPMETGELAGLAVVGFLALVLGIPCGIISAVARTVSLKNEARHSKTSKESNA